MIGATVATLVRVLCGCQGRWPNGPVAPGARIFYANHTSHLDAVLVWSALPAACRRSCRIIAAADYWGANRWRRWLACELLPGVLIDRTAVRRSTNPLNAMLRVLDTGGALILFPEGTRSLTGAVQPFRSGLWHLVRKRPDVPLTPAWLENLNRILPKGEMLPLPLIGAVTFGPEFRWHAPAGKLAFLEFAREKLLQVRESASA